MSLINTQEDEELLMLSGIQHIAFCERQWALIHIEQQWAENVRTIEGNHLHERVDDPFEKDWKKGLVTLRSVTLVSKELGLTGVADVVELISTNSESGYVLPDRSGYWSFRPVEYKRGKPKSDERDEVQLCAQAICLEEMHAVEIPDGSIFYGETRHRIEVVFSQELRKRVKELALRMHELFDGGITPLPVAKKHCRMCSLVDICLPDCMNKYQNVTEYLKWELDMD
jgi:CRISPR-associated exonuclease Cas4